MHIALITNHTDDERPLSEYGFHLARSLQDTAQGRRVTVLSGGWERSFCGEKRVYKYGSVSLVWQIVIQIIKLRPDIVFINTSFTSWGDECANLAGLMLPSILRSIGFKVVTLLHDLPQIIDWENAGFSLTPIHHLAIEIATRSVSKSHALVVLAEDVHSYLESRYENTQVHVFEHGIFGQANWAPIPEKDATILAFGKWGRAKDPRPLLSVYSQLQVPEKLVISGGSHRTKPNFVNELRERYESPFIQITGYVEEACITSIFHQAAVVVFPYNATVGTSGVLFQTCQFGRTPILKGLPKFKELVNRLGINAFWYDTEAELKDVLLYALEDRDQLNKLGKQNAELVSHLSINHVARKYWDLFESLCRQDALADQSTLGLYPNHAKH